MALEILKSEPAASPMNYRPYAKWWGGTIAGFFITCSFELVFFALGAALGLSSLALINPLIPEAAENLSVGNALIGSWIYTLLTQVACFFVGGYCAAKINRVDHSLYGVLSGISSWAVTIVTYTFIFLFMGAYVELFLVGNLPNYSTWLTFSIMMLGVFASALGGFLGLTQAAEYSMIEKEGRESRIRTAS